MTYYNFILLSFVGTLLPFSIAASNIVFGVMLLISMVNRQWWQGVKLLQHYYPWLLYAWTGYILLMLAGLLWTPDRQWGLHILSKQWSWLLVPMLVYLLNTKSTKKRVHIILLAISLGLILHLILCSIQSLGLLPHLNPGVSSREDATGMIGRIGFGLLYGMWSCWLIHYGLQHNRWKRALCWGCALWAIVMVFLAQGRSGYIIILVLSLLLARKLFMHTIPRLKFWLFALLAGIILSIVLWQSESLRHRIKETAISLQQAYHGNLRQAEPRISLWYSAIRGWQANPILGVGTGGFPTLSIEMSKQYNLLYQGKPYATHPHQMYLMDLVRWGPLGLLALLGFLSAWIAIGWRNMESSPYNTLIVASGVALAVHGLSAPSLEEYYGSIYGALFLSIGLAGRLNQIDDRA